MWAHVQPLCTLHYTLQAPRCLVTLHTAQASTSQRGPQVAPVVTTCATPFALFDNALSWRNLEPLVHDVSSAFVWQ